MSTNPDHKAITLPNSPFLKNLFKIFKYLSREVETPYSGDNLLFEILHFPFYQIPVEDIIKITNAASRKRSIALKTYILECLPPIAPDLFSPDPYDTIIYRTRQLDKLCTLIQNTPLSIGLIKHITETTGFDDFARQNASQSVFRQSLIHFYEATGKEIKRHPEYSFSSLIDTISADTSISTSCSPAVFPQQIESEKPQIQAIDSTITTALLRKFVMSATALNNYLDCPLSFFYNNLVRVPRGRAEALSFGSAVHHALEKYFKTMQDRGENQFPPPEVLTDYFTKYMEKHRRHFTTAGFHHRINHGIKILTDYYQYYHESWSTIVSIERNFGKVMMDGVPITGKIDKLVFDGHRVTIIDYKTGKIDRSHTIERLKNPEEKPPYGGGYWRQAAFYHLLLQYSNQKDWQVDHLEFDFIEPDKTGENIKKKVILSPSEADLVRRIIHITWQKIQHHDFFTGCGKQNCHWCNFVREIRW